MRVLVLTAFYPIPNGTYERMFVHIRNQYYRSCGIDVTVLNFDASENYIIDGIPVITSKEFDVNMEEMTYDLVVSHSANLRNHYRWLKKYEKRYSHLVFFFHGHEMLYLNKDYPKPYSYMPSAKWYRQTIQNSYDWLKIKKWSSYYKKLSSKSEFVFVSEWIHKRFKINANLSDDDLKNKVHIINNCVGKEFEINDYDAGTPKLFDFITIRSNIDGSKYCIDLVVKYALENPNLRFLVIGKGEFFKHNLLPSNITWVNDTIEHRDMIEYINQSRCALMLTREDTQGVMTCELATFGIPVITSDIEVCREFFENIENVKMIDNDVRQLNISEISNELQERYPYSKVNQFSTKNTVSKEVELFKRVIRG